MENALHRLARAGDLGALGDAVDGGDHDLDERDHNGATPLMIALLAEQPAAAVLLLDRGASIAVKDLGGRTALDWAYAYPDLIARIKSMGGASGRVDTLETPYDRDDFEPMLEAFLGLFREGAILAEPHAELLELLEPEPPPDLAALIHTWAHKPRSSFEDVGRFWIESRAVHRTPRAALELIHGSAEAYGITIGSDPSGHVAVVASWQPGDRRCRVDAVDDEGYAERIGPLGDFD